MAQPARPKLLFATHMVPYPVDMACKGRMMHLLHHLSESFEITLVSLSHTRDTDEAAEVLKLDCRRFVPILSPNKRSLPSKIFFGLRSWGKSFWSGVPTDYHYANVPTVERRFRQIVQDQGPFDVILVEYWYTSDFLSKFTSPLKIVDTHDVDWKKNSELLQNTPNAVVRFFKRIRQRNNARREMDTLRRFDVILALTDHDREVFQSALGERKSIHVLPTGVDTEFFHPRNVKKSHRRITFYGSMQSEGNIQAARYFYESLFPRIRKQVPDAEYVILGAHPPESLQALEQDPQVTVTGFVQDVRPHLESSNLVVCPFRMGYGFRGRVLEVMSLELPVVASSIAVKAMGLNDGEGILLRNTAESFAEATIDLLLNKDKARALGKAGRRTVLSRFSLESTYGTFCEMLAASLAGPRQSDAVVSTPQKGG